MRCGEKEDDHVRFDPSLCSRVKESTMLNIHMDRENVGPSTARTPMATLSRRSVNTPFSVAPSGKKGTKTPRARGKAGAGRTPGKAGAGRTPFSRLANMTPGPAPGPGQGGCGSRVQMVQSTPISKPLEPSIDIDVDFATSGNAGSCRQEPDAAAARALGFGTLFKGHAARTAMGVVGESPLSVSDWRLAAPPLAAADPPRPPLSQERSLRSSLQTCRQHNR